MAIPAYLWLKDDGGPILRGLSMYKIERGALRLLVLHMD